jgi:adenylylsulfate kinase
VVASVLSIFPDWQQWNRDNLSRYFEVFLDAPLDVLRERKPLYREAEAGRMRDVVGVDIPFPAPPHPDLAADTSGRDGTPEEIAQRIVSAARARFPGMSPEPSHG